MIKRVYKDVPEEQRHTLYVFGSLEVRRTAFAGDAYTISNESLVPYAMANGVRLARLHYSEGANSPQVSGTGLGEQAYRTNTAATLHVLLELGDHLGSTGTVLDKLTSELVEKTTYLPFGARENDYRGTDGAGGSNRWSSFREDYGFTGKEEDVEVGLTYFGKRFLSSQLGRWVTADPLAVHVPGRADFNLYAYVSGAVLSAVDPVGLEMAQREQGSDMPGNTPDASSPYVSRSEPAPAPMNATTGAHGNNARGDSSSAPSTPNACEEMSPEASNTEGKSGGMGGPNIKAGPVGAPKPGPLTGANGTTPGTGGSDTRAYEQWRADADQGRLGGGVHGSGNNATSLPARAHAGNIDTAVGVAASLVGAGAALRLTLPSIGDGVGISRAARAGMGASERAIPGLGELPQGVAVPIRAGEPLAIPRALTPNEMAALTNTTGNIEFSQTFANGQHWLTRADFATPNRVLVRPWNPGETQWISHSHPAGYSGAASPQDKLLLRGLGQGASRVVRPDGSSVRYTHE